MPEELAVGRHTFMDFGPPFDYYEIILVRPDASGLLIRRILLTPAGAACVQPATVEVSRAHISESISYVLENKNPCAISARRLRREQKRCKRCLVFSGANIAMQAKCGLNERIIRADILDRDMFDPRANTPENTAWTMRLLARLDEKLGPGVWEKPIFPTQSDELHGGNVDSEAVADIRSGRYDALFAKAPHRMSALLDEASTPTVPPTVVLVESTPFRPAEPLGLGYSPIARLARLEGRVSFKVKLDSAAKPAFIDLAGNPMLKGPVQAAIEKWQFPEEAANQEINGVVEFKLNCSTKKEPDALT